MASLAEKPMRSAPADLPDEVKGRNARVLDHSGLSGWLEDARRAALDRGPLVAPEDLEIPGTLIRARAKEQLGKRQDDQGGGQAGLPAAMAGTSVYLSPAAPVTDQIR